MIYESDKGDIVHIPVNEITGEKTMKDGSTRFKFVGGPYHDMIFRVFPPYDIIRWEDGTTYEIHPPLNLKRSSKWVYVYNMEASMEKEISIGN